ncbi:DHHA1 domain-containing protein [Candidatus Pelagibacter sp.]|nr:DHHA1 domain-containing protein [Candidatus Pelagibacter sp.]
MKSVSGKNWEELVISKRLVDKTKIDYDLSINQAKLAVLRDFNEIELFSIKNKVNFTNPFLKDKDFLLATKLLNDNINKKNKILIIGDYDVDGCISTSLMVNFIKSFNLNVKYYIPDRFKDGYGASLKLIRELILKQKPSLLIFLDCGSNAHEAIEFARNNKVKSFIIDHHNAEQPLPLSDILINPKKDKSNTLDYFCSAFLTFFFIDCYLKQYKLKMSIKENLIYVLLATVADIMPLRNINRIMAINVLNNFDINKNYIIQNLLRISKVKKKLEIDDLGFLIAPIFNSAGRIENANQIVELLTTTSEEKIIYILNKIYKLNLKRKLIEKRNLKNINFKDLTHQKGIIFIYKSNIPLGIIGIIAAKIKEYFNRPCVVFTNSGKIIKGSARSTDDFNIGEYINKALKEKILLNGGGHNLAAGISISKDKLNLFKEFLNKYLIKSHSKFVNNFISKISINSINKDLVNEINLLGPFGNKNDYPIYLIENVKLIKPSLINNNFVTCYAKSGNRMIKCISFNQINSEISYEIINSKKNMDLLVKIKENKWNNKSSIQLEIIDVIKSVNKT